jgi:hypothetical protein
VDDHLEPSRAAAEVDRLATSPDGSTGSPLTVTDSTRWPRGSRTRSFSVFGAGRAGASTVARIVSVRASSVYETGPKLVGALRTEIRRPARSHGRGVAKASSSPTGAPSASRASCTSSDRSVSRKAAFEALFGGRYIERRCSPARGATLAASPDTNVFGVIATASDP